MHVAQDSSSFILLHEHSKVFQIIYTNCPGFRETSVRESDWKVRKTTLYGKPRITYVSCKVQSTVHTVYSLPKLLRPSRQLPVITLRSDSSVQKMECATIPKVRGFVYAHANQMYERVRTTGIVKYLKCSVTGYDGSAKLVADQFVLGLISQLLLIDV